MAENQHVMVVRGGHCMVSRVRLYDTRIPKIPATHGNYDYRNGLAVLCAPVYNELLVLLRVFGP